MSQRRVRLDPKEAQFAELTVLRPLLDVRRNQVHAVLESQGHTGDAPGHLQPAARARACAPFGRPRPPILHRAFEDAVRWGPLGRNPYDLVEPPHAPRPEIRPFSAAEVAQLLAACADDPLGPLVTVAVLTGLRLGVVLGLQRRDVDWERGELSVVRAVQRATGRGLIVVEPKTASSRRRNPLPLQALETLREQRRRLAAQHLAAGPAWTGGD